MRLLQPVDLEYFLEICRQGSIARAAAVLGVTQPTLSKCLKRLEQQAGARLCDRNAQGIVPTEMGHYLVAQADHILAQLRATSCSLQELSGVRKGTASIGLAPMLCHQFAPALIERALALRPGLSFRVAEGLFEPLLQQLQQGELDFILSSPSAAGRTHPDLVSEPLGVNRFVACVGARHPLVQGDGGAGLPAPAEVDGGVQSRLAHDGGTSPRVCTRHVDPNALATLDWVLVSPRGILRRVLTDLFKAHGLTPPVAQVETNSAVLLKTLLLTNRYISFLPEDMVAAELASGQFVRLDLPWLVWQRELYLTTRRHRTLSPAALFMKTLATDLAREAFNAADV